MIKAKLVEARARKGWSLMDLSKVTKISKQSLHSYEKGVKPSLKNLESLSKAFNVPVDYFLTNETGKVDLVIPSVKKEFKSKIKDAVNFTAAEQEAIIKVIDLIQEKRKLSQKLTDVISHAS